MKMFVIGTILILNGIMAFASEADRQNAIRQSYVLEGKLDYASAIKALATQYNQTPDDYFINLRMGWLNYMSKNYKNALQHYNTALDAKSDSRTAGMGKVNTLAAQLDWNGYENALKTMSKTFTTDYEINMRLANYYLNTKKYGEGLKITEKLMTFYPETVELLNTHGYLSMLDGKTEQAEKMFHHVLSISPDNVIAKGHLTELAKNKS